MKKRVGSVTIVELQRAGGTQQVELAFDDVEKEILARPQTLWFLVWCLFVRSVAGIVGAIRGMPWEGLPSSDGGFGFHQAMRLLYLGCLDIVGMPSRHPPPTRIGTLRHTPLYDGPCFPNDSKGLPTVPR